MPTSSRIPGLTPRARPSNWVPVNVTATMATTALLFVGAVAGSWLATGAITLVWMSALSRRVRGGS